MNPPLHRIESVIAAYAARQPDHLALRFHTETWTYAALCEDARRRAALLCEAGIQPGEVIVGTGSVTGDTAVSALACIMANAVYYYLSPLFAPPEIAARAAMAGARLVLTPTGERDAALPHLPALPRALPGNPSPGAVAAVAARQAAATTDDPALLQSTSGTTGGRAKITRMTHRHHALPAAMPFWTDLSGAVTYIPRPMLYNASLFYDSLNRGGTCILSDWSQPERIEAEMADYGANALWTVPAIVQALVTQQQPPPPGLALRILRTTAASLSPELAQAARERYGAAVAQALGSTEVGYVMLTTPDAPAGRGARPVPWAEVRLVDETGCEVPEGNAGELLVRSPNVMTGYVGDPEATAAAFRDGWFCTGDLARRDAGGFYYLVGRQVLRINVGGFKVSPEEVEAVLLRHPGVREAVVLGAADATRGEVVRAVIVPAEPPPSVATLRAYCRAHLATYKVPRRWEFREALPCSPLGKVLRHLL